MVVVFVIGSVKKNLQKDDNSGPILNLICIFIEYYKHMKKGLPVLLFVLILVFSANNIHAQRWEWANAGIGDVDEYGESVITDAVGNVYVSGTFNSRTFTYGTTVMSNPGCAGPGACDVPYIMKCDPLGNLIWEISAAGNADIVSLAIDDNGDIYAAGHFYSPTIIFGAVTLTNDSNGTYDVFIVKYDTSGHVIWAKNAGGKGDDFVTAVKADHAGNAYVTGYFTSSSITFGVTTLLNDTVSTGNVFIVKYDAEGNVKWAKGSGGKQDDEIQSVTTDAAGYVYITGFFNSPSIIFGHDTLINRSNVNMFLVKYDSLGNVIWANDPGSHNNNVPASISTDMYGNVYVAGYFYGVTTNFGTTTLFNSDTSNPGDTYNIFLAKYDSAGHIKWAKGAIVDNYAQATTVINDVSGNIYMSGFTLSSTMIFDRYSIAGDIFLVKFDSSGNVMGGANAVGNIGDDYPSCITIDAAGGLYMTGNFGSWVMSFGGITLRDTNNYYMFLAKYNEVPVLTPVITKNDPEIMIYPNPANTGITITSSEEIKQVTLNNILGQIVYSNDYATQQVHVDIFMLPAGVYFIKINGSEIRKLVKQ